QISTRMPTVNPSRAAVPQERLWWTAASRAHERTCAGTVAAMARPNFRYSRWDGTQVGFDLDAEAILEEITDDLLYHGDLHSALRRLMQQGFRDRNGEQLMGLRELMERLRRQRRDRLERHDLGGVYEE